MSAAVRRWRWRSLLTWLLGRFVSGAAVLDRMTTSMRTVGTLLLGVQRCSPASVRTVAIKERYTEAWDCFDAVIFSMQQNGLLMLQRMDEAGEDDHSDVRTALSLIHSSATVILYEIRTLLLEGLWAGAAARWRALHELTVTAVLVARGEGAIASRYLNHGFVVQTKRLVDFYDRHGRGPLSPDELKRRQAKSETLIDRFTLPDQHGSFRDP